MNGAPTKLAPAKRKLLWIGAALTLFLAIAGLSVWVGCSIEKKNAGARSEINEIFTIMKDTFKTSLDPRKQGRAIAAERRMLAAEKFAFEKKYEEAHQAFEEAAQGYASTFGASSPLTITLLLRSGELECEFKRWDRAEGKFGQALKDMPEGGSQSMRYSLEEWMVYTLENESKYKEAIVILLKQLQAAEKNEHDPSGLRSALKALADCYAFDHQNAAADRLYSRLLLLVQKRFGGESRDAKKIQAAIERTRAIAQLDHENYEQALKAFDNAAVLDPDDEWTASERAWTSCQLEQYQKAKDVCDRQLAAHPRSIWALRLRGQAEQQLGQFEKALADCNKAISLDPEDAHLYNNRAEAYEKLGQKDQAAQDRATALKLGHEQASSVQTP